MNRLTIAIPYTEDKQFETLARQFIAHQLVEEVLCLRQSAPPSLPPSLLKDVKAVNVDAFFSGPAINTLIEAWRTDYLLLILPGGRVELGARAPERFVQVADDAGAAFVYSDFRQQSGAEVAGLGAQASLPAGSRSGQAGMPALPGEVADHPLIDYQLGAIRDNFDFGSLVLLSREEVEKALRDHGGISPDIRWGGLYDLRLKLSINSTIFRIPEPLYTRVAADLRASGEKIFDYVDPRKRDYQIEMEKIATEHLERIGARLEPIVAEFDSGKYAMVIGSYTIVDFDLNELPPGLIDHREWTRENGRNNALRINGLGAPRAFDVTVLRRIGLPNTSYGEDYAVTLRVSREYEIGRIYDSLYFARRWSDNSDSALPLATMNRYDAYKDRLRTIEILARQRLVGQTLVCP